MYNLKKDIIPGAVVWGERNIYYDDPGRILYGKRAMYVVTMINDDYFFGCPLIASTSYKNSTILSPKHYPIKKESRINQCLYKLYYSQIVSPLMFNITARTFEHFKRNLYKRIILGYAESPESYNELFVEEYLKEQVPKIDNIIVYPSEDKEFKYYYVYDETEESYVAVRLNEEITDGVYNYSLLDKNLVHIPKSIRFFDIFTTHSLKRETVEDGLEGRSLQKSLGTYPKK